MAVKTEKQEIVGGKKITLLNSLEAYGSQSFSWLIKGTGKINIEIGCPTAGSKNVEISL